MVRPIWKGNLSGKMETRVTWVLLVYVSRDPAIYISYRRGQ